jgi:hypothetical protein
VALAGKEQVSEKSGFAEMIDTDDVRKRDDLLDSDFFAAQPQSEALLLTPLHMLMFVSIATPQWVLINDLAPPGSFLSRGRDGLALLRDGAAPAIR